MKRIIQFTLLSILFASCSKDDTEVNANSTVAVESITINGAETQLTSGFQFTLTADVLTEGATDKSIYWMSSNEDYAEVDQEGVVTTKTSGFVKISAISVSTPTVSKSVGMTIYDPIRSISITQDGQIITELPMLIGGGDVQLGILVDPDTSVDDVEWTSDDPSVVTVSKTGLLSLAATAQISDTATISATSTFDSSKVASCTITVSDEATMVSTITISGATTLNVDDKTTLIAVVSPDEADNKSVTWSVYSGGDYADVDSSTGEVTAIAAGSVQIIATANDSSGKVSDPFEITIVANVLTNLITNAGKNATFEDCTGTADHNWVDGLVAITGNPINGTRSGVMRATNTNEPYLALDKTTITHGKKYKIKYTIRIQDAEGAEGSTFTTTDGEHVRMVMHIAGSPTSPFYESEKIISNTNTTIEDEFTVDNSGSANLFLKMRRMDENDAIIDYTVVYIDDISIVAIDSGDSDDEDSNADLDSIGEGEKLY